MKQEKTMKNDLVGNKKRTSIKVMYAIQHAATNKRPTNGLQSCRKRQRQSGLDNRKKILDRHERIHEENENPSNPKNVRKSKRTKLQSNSARRNPTWPTGPYKKKNRPKRKKRIKFILHVPQTHLFKHLELKDDMALEYLSNAREIQ